MPVDEPVLFEVVWDNAMGSIEWFMNGALQVRGGFRSRGSIFGETNIALRGQMFVAVGPAEPDQYDVLVDDIHLTLRY